ncbi:MAG: asparagine synthase (glutamine-hydrolyzing) [Anaerolineales bacterium]|nr:asparagine synthase (glutamine-hydrolyzing) [Anaerolineales bacterium]
MCGICGIADGSGRSLDQAALHRLNTALTHRGPDGEGYYEHNGIGLGMRRLAIIDVAGSDQPIFNEDKSIAIVFNGEIYSYQHLRAGLLQRGHQLRTNGDTECIVHLYEEEGPECLRHLRGMFALALWDENRGRLLLARDRLGKKPIFYTVQDGKLYWAAELGPLLSVLPRQPENDLAAIDQYLSLQYIPEPYTAYKGVYKLPAASYAVWERGELHIERYWEPNFEPKYAASEDALSEELRELAAEAVRLRLISEVPLGAHLSGGIDSSIVVALMAEASRGPVKTFSVGFEESSFSELPLARQVAERYGTEHHEFMLTFGDIPTTLETLLQHFGEPFADPSALPLYHLSRLTREHVTVALNGDGGDESFAGYPRYWLDPLADTYLRLPRAVTRRLVPALAGALPDAGDRPVGRGLSNGIKRLPQLTEVDARASLLRWSSYFTVAQKTALWQPDVGAVLNLRQAVNDMAGIYGAAPANTRLDRTLYTDIKTYLPGGLLVKADRMTMAHGLEGRSPFLDHVLVEWAARLPVRYKLRGRRGKYLLRKAFADKLPADVLAHGKQGFGIPVGAWLRGPLEAWLRELLLAPDAPLAGWFGRDALAQLIAEHQAGKQDHGKRLWALACLALWKRSSA